VARQAADPAGGNRACYTEKQPAIPAASRSLLVVSRVFDPGRRGGQVAHPSSGRSGRAGWFTHQVNQERADTITNKVFVGSLSYDTSQSEVEELFSQIGEVVDVFLPVDRDTGRPRGMAFVEFAERSAVAEAIERLDGTELNNRAIRVKEAEERQPRPPRFSDGGSPDRFRPRSPKPKGSRRNLRGRKRGF